MTVTFNKTICFFSYSNTGFNPIICSLKIRLLVFNYGNYGMCIISVITSPPLPLDVLSACSTNWCTCMSSRIRILKAFSSEIKFHRCFTCLPDLVMAFLCSTISSDSVSSKSLSESLSNSSIWKGSGSVPMRTWGIFSSLTKVT